ncbi:MAG: hypothetical protein RR254_06445 [Muribaculaceae bacterium]
MNIVSFIHTYIKSCKNPSFIFHSLQLQPNLDCQNFGTYVDDWDLSQIRDDSLCVRGTRMSKMLKAGC